MKMIKAQIFTSFLFLLTAALGITARPDPRPQVRSIVRRSSSPTTSSPGGVEKWTNARRLAAGLTPRKPNNLFSPSRVVARTPRPSSTPEKKCWIFVDRVNNHGWNKYVSKDHTNHEDYYGVDVPEQKRMVIKFSLTSGPLNLELLTSSSYPYLGFAGSLLGSNDAFPMTDTDQTSPGSTPQSTSNSLSPTKSESAVWSYDSGSARFTVQWIQPNGSPISTKFWYFNNEGKLAIVKSSTTPNKGWEVNLYCDAYQESR